jgi:hypothetical protein
MSRTCGAWIGALGGALALHAVGAAEASPDGELLEFLGSVDSEGDGWNEYLEDTEFKRVATPPPAPPAPSPPPPRQEPQS